MQPGITHLSAIACGVVLCLDKDHVLEHVFSGLPGALLPLPAGL
jgi:hypothetical protein